MSLKDRLIRRIAAEGPLRLSDYMAACLTDPVDGYYVTRDPLGADFITAPEISQMFGELMGLCLAQVWVNLGQPPRVVLAELGPGRGTLMSDMLRAMAAVPGLRDAVQVHLVETSPVLRAEQAKRVPDAVWHGEVQGLPDDRPLLLVANEFFDALPIRQFRRGAAQWHEVQITAKDGQMVPGLSPPVLLDWLDADYPQASEGDVVERCEELRPAMDTICARLSGQGGAALIVDYGDWASLGDTFQAVRGNAKVDPFTDPGLADLTAHVDFEQIAKAAQRAGLWHSRLTPQGVFLERLGITARAQALARGLGGAALDAHIAAHRRLTHPDEMGTLFKVMAVASPFARPIPGCVDEP